MAGERPSPDGALFEAFPHATWIYDLETASVVAANEAAAHSYGWPLDELVGRPVSELVHPDDGEALEARLAELRQDPLAPPKVLRWRRRRRDGSTLWADVHSTAVTWHGRAARMVVARDVTGIVEVADRLRLIEAAMDQASDAVLITDAQALGRETPRIVYVNAKFLRLTGYSREDALGRPAQMLKHPETSNESLRRLRTAYAERTATTEELIISRRDGSPSWVELTMTPLADGDGAVTHWISIQRDVTERRRAQTALLERSRIDAVARLAAGVAHDFNNLLTVIASSAELARWELPADHPAEARLTDIEAAAERARAHTGQLLAVSRREPISELPLDVNAAIRSTLPALERVAGDHVRLHLALPEEPLRARVDGDQLEQALRSLVANARDAQPDGGQVRITARRTGDGHVEVAVEDDGPGLSRQAADRAFEPFWSTKPLGSGAGLGLPTVRWIAARSGGTARIERAESGGARLVVAFPDASLDASSSGSDEGERAPSQNQGP